MIKNLFLKHKGKPFDAKKEHCTYAESSSIGILYHEGAFGSDQVMKLADLLQKDGKQVSQMGFCDKPTTENNHFHKKDISLVGTIKKPSLATFVEQPFDFLISLDITGNPNYRYILALCKASCKVGLETEKTSDLLQLSIKMDETIAKSITNLVRYLKMI